MDRIIDLNQHRHERQRAGRREQLDYLERCQSRLNHVCDEVGRCVDQLHRLLEESHLLRAEMRRVQGAIGAARGELRADATLPKPGASAHASSLAQDA